MGERDMSKSVHACGLTHLLQGLLQASQGPLQERSELGAESSG